MSTICIGDVEHLQEHSDRRVSNGFLALKLYRIHLFELWGEKSNLDLFLTVKLFENCSRFPCGWYKMHHKHTLQYPADDQILLIICSLPNEPQRCRLLALSLSFILSSDSISVRQTLQELFKKFCFLLV